MPTEVHKAGREVGSEPTEPTPLATPAALPDLREDSRKQDSEESWFGGEGSGKGSQGKCSFIRHLEGFQRGMSWVIQHAIPRDEKCAKPNTVSHRLVASLVLTWGLLLATAGSPISLGCLSLWVGRRTRLPSKLPTTPSLESDSAPSLDIGVLPILDLLIPVSIVTS